ncbi:MAG TPA: hypothetical protein VE109_12810 [Acidobacteriaceae bacterium]|nr:hypothetical protein [Acidobacteriaceae bacterium]
MQRCFFTRICTGLLLLAASPLAMAQPTPEAVAAFNAYAGTVESRLAQQHRSDDAFLASTASDRRTEMMRLRNGELIVVRIPDRIPDQPFSWSEAEFSGSLLHHWRGTAFVPGATAADFERLMQNFQAYPRYFSPQVLQAALIAQSGDRMQAFMRVRQKHILTAVMDITYDVDYARLDKQHGYSVSRSTRIAEIDSPGTASERALNASEQHGFLWRLNTYWSYEEKDGGLYLQIESISLTRSIPHGLGWVIRPYIESIPRESLEFTLRSTCNALRR